jgi:predicted nucleic acid-binding Zn finger protein
MKANMITIQGLTHKQKVFMDVMWAMDSMPAVEAFINSLPKRDSQDCQSLVAIAVQESLEEDNRLDLYEQDTIDLIARVSSR